MGETAKQQHRAEAAELHRGSDGMVRCILRGRINEQGFTHECAGRLECHHVIEAQRLKKLWERARFYARNPSPTMKAPSYYRVLSGLTLEELVKDGRNSAWACSTAHRQIEKRRFLLPHLPLVEAFAHEYNLEHEIPVWDSPASNAA